MTSDKLAIFERVRGCAADIFQVDESTITLASSPDTIDTWDSVNHLSFVLALEEEFALTFPPEDVVEMLNIDLVTLLVQEKLNGA